MKYTPHITTVEYAFVPLTTRFAHIINDKPLTIIQITHCSMQRLTVKYIPIIDKNVVIPSIIGLLSPVKYSKKIVNAQPNIPTSANFIRSTASNFVFIISFDFSSKCVFHLKIPKTCIGI